MTNTTLKTNGTDLIALLNDLLAYEYDYKSQDTSYKIISTVDGERPIVTANFMALNNDDNQSIIGSIKFMLDPYEADLYQEYEDKGYPYNLRFIDVCDSRSKQTGNHIPNYGDAAIYN